MTFTIHAWKADRNVTTVRIGPAVAVDKARELEKMGWEVYVTDAAGSQFTPLNFDQLLLIAQDSVALSGPGRRRVSGAFVKFTAGPIDRPASDDHIAPSASRICRASWISLRVRLASAAVVSTFLSGALKIRPPPCFVTSPRSCAASYSSARRGLASERSRPERSPPRGSACEQIFPASRLHDLNGHAGNPAARLAP